MTTATRHGDVSVEVGDDFVAIAEIQRPPNNFFDLDLLRSLADVYAALEEDPSCRAIVLCSQGKHFSAGADFSGASESGEVSLGAGRADFVEAVVRMLECKKPVIAAVQGAAIGGGLGLACSADFRVACPEARFAAVFARLGFHHGYGLTVTLPLIVGHQRTIELLYTGRRVGGEEAKAMGLCDRLVPAAELRAEAQSFAAEIAGSAPLAVVSIKETMRGDLPARVRDATGREVAEQERLRGTEDWLEGLAASRDRRLPRFQGK